MISSKSTAQWRCVGSRRRASRDSRSSFVRSIPQPAVDIDDEEEEEPPHLSLDGTSGPRDPAPKKARTENRAAQLEYPESLPYPAESIEQMDARLDHIIRRLVDCVHTKE